MNRKIFKTLISFVLIFGLFGGIIGAKETYACYPAYKCMSNSVIPKSYKLIYQNKDRRKGIVVSGVTLGGLSFLGTPASVISFVVGTASLYKETYKSYLSYKVYVKKSDKKGYRFKVKTVFYKNINFKGATKTVYSYEN
ncbi:hypothetical protein HT574_03795 [Parageobacillus sp. VR-IP]|uniref:hypothetical protein n=1 Tax=Parageobacillus sp. VR-IP TaxID=2742205 RepID=UPI00158224C8|nr:hypothetical protein [Parageobacillus sp. VR-IP]NUK29254.1 hypothetical protein [Parageobacillus sp. VR-IP]